MHNCRCLRPFSVLLSRGSAGPIIKRLYASENPKWTQLAEEQFAGIFKRKEKPPRDHSTETPRPAKATPVEPPVPKATPPPPPPPIEPETIVRRSTRVLPTLPPLPSASARAAPAAIPPRPIRHGTSEQLSPIRRYNDIPQSRAQRQRRHQHQHQQQPQQQQQQQQQQLSVYDPVPQVLNLSDAYARAARVSPKDTKPTQNFEQLEAEERAINLSEERESVIKIWVEGLPMTDKSMLEEGLSKLAEHPIKISEPEVVTDRGMIATKCAFFTVDFGKNNREKIFYQLENFGLTIKGIRCPVRTAEVKRSLTLIELGQISELALVEALKEHDIRYATYDYPSRYNSPQRQIAFPYRGSVILTFRSHNEAYETKRRFDSPEGITVGENRIYALWGPRAGAQPLETRTAANYMRNLIWENRDLRKYMTEVRKQNAKLEEPTEFNDLTKTLETQQTKEIERQRKLEEIKLQLEKTRRALMEARSEASEGNEEVKKAEEAIDLAKQFEAELQNEAITDSVRSKSVTLSPYVSKVENPDAFATVTETYETKFMTLKQKHSQEMKNLKQQFDTQRKQFTRELFAKNNRNATKTAEELGIKRIAVQRDTKLKPARKKIRVKSRKVATTDSSEGSESSESSEGSEGTVDEGDGSSDASGDVEAAETSEQTEESDETEGTETTQLESEEREEKENRETGHEGDTDLRAANEKEDGEDTKAREPRKTGSKSRDTESTTKTAKKNTRAEETTVIVDSSGNERVAKVVDWK